MQKEIEHGDTWSLVSLSPRKHLCYIPPASIHRSICTFISTALTTRALDCQCKGTDSTYMILKVMQAAGGITVSTRMTQVKISSEDRQRVQENKTKKHSDHHCSGLVFLPFYL
jgi:hypothetical protein